jgi:hypothetical protein
MCFAAFSLHFWAFFFTSAQFFFFSSDCVDFVPLLTPPSSLTLLQCPQLGMPGLPGVGLDATWLPFVQRFDPTDPKLDSIGFFLAKFIVH